MRIIVVTQHIFPIQSPRAIRSTELIKELARRGHSVTVYAVLGKYDYSDFQQKTGIVVKQIPIRWELFPNNSDGSGRRAFIDRVLGRLFRKFEFPFFEFYFRIPKLLKKETDFDAACHGSGHGR